MNNSIKNFLSPVLDNLNQVMNKFESLFDPKNENKRNI